MRKIGQEIFFYLVGRFVVADRKCWHLSKSIDHSVLHDLLVEHCYMVLMQFSRFGSVLDILSGSSLPGHSYQFALMKSNKNKQFLHCTYCSNAKVYKMLVKKKTVNLKHYIQNMVYRVQNQNGLHSIRTDFQIRPDRTGST